MTIRSASWLVILLAAACATTAPLPPPAAPDLRGREIRLDPRLGSTTSTTSEAFASGVAALNQGLLEKAEADFIRVTAEQDAAAQATLGRAIVAFRRGDIDVAEELLDRATQAGSWAAAEILAAELLAERGKSTEAIARYEEIDSPPTIANVVADRIQQLRRNAFDSLYAAAATQQPEQAIATLREAITFVDAEPARLLLARRLIELGRYDEARRALDQLQIRGALDTDQLQELLAEVEVGKGRYQEAIARLEPLARRDPVRYGGRLEEIKQRWSEANMPQHYHAALSSAAVTRTQLATILYWKLPAVRFARNLSEPPIAVDLSYGSGREEMIRALAMGLFSVDPVTRTASPDRVVRIEILERIAARLLRLGGLPACAAPVAGDPGAELEACGIPMPSADPVTGPEVARTIEAIAELHP